MAQSSGQSNQFKILAFGGSFRKGSYSTALMHAAKELAPKGAAVEIFDLAHIPLYNQDDEKSMPAPVADFKSKIEASDAVLIVTPEFNYSVPGYLKNALDWASRPYGKNSFAGKPAAILSNSVGVLGGVRAQYHLRQMLVHLDVHPLNQPQVMVSNEMQKFDSSGRLTDEETRTKISELLKALVVWGRQLKK